MASPVQRVATLLGLRKADGDQGPPPDDRTLLQVLLGNLFFAAISGGVSVLLGSDAVAAISFGVLIYVLFLFLDLQHRRKQREHDEEPPPA